MPICRLVAPDLGRSAATSAEAVLRRRRPSRAPRVRKGPGSRSQCGWAWGTQPHPALRGRGHGHATGSSGPAQPDNVTARGLAGSEGIRQRTLLARYRIGRRVTSESAREQRPDNPDQAAREAIFAPADTHTVAILNSFATVPDAARAGVPSPQGTLASSLPSGWFPCKNSTFFTVASMVFRSLPQQDLICHYCRPRASADSRCSP
jgi:hypothetical protein